MHLEQERILKRFKTLFGDPTYKEMAEISDIQLTRIFRLNNGFEMKMSEYLKIKKAIDDKIAQTSKVHIVFNECLENLSVNALLELEKICSRKLEMYQLVASKSLTEVVA